MMREPFIPGYKMTKHGAEFTGNITTLQLHRVPEHKHIKVRIIRHDPKVREHPPSHRDFAPDEIFTFVHIDGMYSLCYDSEGKPVHLVAWQEVEIVE